MYQLDPCSDKRWPEFLERHARASVFHTPGWLAALQRTYGYEPVVFTTTPPARELENGIVFCRIRSLLTGRRLVSLPFSDHCEPLVDGAAEIHGMLESLRGLAKHDRYKYIEVRPVFAAPVSAGDYATSERFYRHSIDLRPTLANLLSSFEHKRVQKRIAHAEREDVRCECGDSEDLVLHYYSLVLKTRQRQGLPPQPLVWYRNLLECLRGAVTIHLAYHDGRPIAGIVLLMHKQSAVAKHAANDEALRHLAGGSLALWKSIADAKSRGGTEFDLGRTDLDHTGLVAFKNRWGSAQSELRYWRCPPPASSHSLVSWKMRLAKHLFGRLPGSLAEFSGRVLYRHFG